MPWWEWVLVLWPVWAIPAGVAVGMFIAAGDRWGHR